MKNRIAHLSQMNINTIRPFLLKCADRSFMFELFKNNRIPTHLTFNEKLILSVLASNCRGKLLEIGSYLGASACYIASTISDNSSSRLYCVDTWENDAMSEGKQETYSLFLNNTVRYRNRIVALRGKSKSIGKSFNNKINFIFFDGDHSYHGIREDVQVWLPKLDSGSIVVFHDIGWAEGVQKIVKEEINPHAKKEGRLPNMYWAWL